MTPAHPLIDQLEGALSSNDVSRRADALHRVTDLFALGSGTFSDDQIELFDDVMGRLVENIELSARAKFGNRLAMLTDAPRKITRQLAFDDAIEVAAPILMHSERLDDAALVENARSMSQDHLLAISSRRTLAEAVTDVLIERGNQVVVTSTARNTGAKFSESGISNLVAKSHHDIYLAECVWTRQDIPRQNLIKLFAEASDATKKMLAARDPRRAAMIRAAVAHAQDQVQVIARAGSDEHAEARALVRSLHTAGQLDEAHLSAFATEGSFDKTAVALSLMSDLPIGLIERALVQNQTEQILVLAKAINLSWDTTMALLLMQAGVNGSSRDQLDQCFASFCRLQAKTAQTAVQFYRMRERAGRPRG